MVRVVAPRLPPPPGLTTAHGLVAFLTTNHRDQLDAALVRPGRVDLELEFHPPAREEVLMALRVLGAAYAAEHEAWANAHPEVTLAFVQRHLFECLMEERASMM